jgi:two-component system sensor histidine kinase UhpB
VAAGVALVWAVSARWDLFERFQRWAGREEAWQADELWFALMALALGLAWYAVRRQREARAAQLREVALHDHHRELVRQLILAQEAERRHLARELHDELAQGCTAIRVDAAWLARAADAGPLHEAAGRIGAAAEGLQRQVRGMLRRLRPAELDALGLVAALNALVDGWRARGPAGDRPGQAPVRLHLEAQGELDGLGDAHDVTLYRVAQEALANVMRHAGAQAVVLRLERLPDGAVTLTVRDDGRGMDPALPTAGLGLLGAAERAAALGGRLDLDGAPGRGLTLRLWLPAPGGPGTVKDED